MMSHVTSDSAPEAGPEQHELQVIGESEMPADEAAEPPAKPPQQEEIVENAMSWCDRYIRYDQCSSRPDNRAPDNRVG